MSKDRVNLVNAVQEHILTGLPITRIECLVLFGVPDLTKVVSDLRKNGYKIESRRVAFIQAIRRINEYAVLLPPKDLPVKQVNLTEYYWLGQ